MKPSRRIVAAVLVALAATGVVGWAIGRGWDGASARIADGTRVRDGDRAKRGADAKAAPDLIGAQEAPKPIENGRPHRLVIVVEGPSGVIASATVTVEVEAPFELPERSIEAPTRERRRAISRVQVGATDARGRAAFDVVGVTSASLDVTAEGFMPRSTTVWLVENGVAGATEETRVSLEAAVKIEGRIVDADGNPIALAVVRTGPSDVPDAISDSDGAFRFWVDMTTRDLTLGVTAEGFADGRLDVALWNGVVDPPSIAIRLDRRGAEPPRGSVDVTVRDSRSRPLAHASVSIEESETADATPRAEPPSIEDVRGRTDETGHCLLTSVPVGRAYRVTASAAGHADGGAATTIRLDSESSIGRAEVTLLDLGSLVVTVLDADGLPAFGDVELSGPFMPDKRENVSTGASRYRGLEPGPLKVTASLDGRLPASGTVEIRSGVEAALTLRLGKGVSIRGRVVDSEGHPVAGVWVRAARRPTTAPTRAEDDDADAPRQVFLGDACSPAATDGEGAFTFDGLHEGAYRVTALRRAERDGDPDYAGMADALAPSIGSRVVLRRLGSVRAKLIRPDGTVFQGDVFVSVWPNGLDTRTPHRADEDGMLSISGVEDGDHEVRVDVAGYPGLRLPVAMKDGRAVDLGAVSLEEGATVRGRVVDANGQPVESASVGVAGRSAKTGADGSFEFEHVSREEHTVDASADGFVASHVAVDLSSGDGTVEVRLARGGVVRGSLCASDASERRGTLTFVDRRADATDDDERARVVVNVRADGRYLIALAPGAWEAHWTAPEGEPVVLATITVKEGAVQNLDLAVAPK